MSETWWDDLDPAQLRLYGGYIDAEVRLLGKAYGRAVESVRANDRIRREVLAVRATPNPDCASRARPHGPHTLASPGGGNKPGACCDGLRTDDPDTDAALDAATTKDS